MSKFSIENSFGKCDSFFFNTFYFSIFISIIKLSEKYTFNARSRHDISSSEKKLQKTVHS